MSNRMCIYRKSDGTGHSAGLLVSVSHVCLHLDSWHATSSHGHRNSVAIVIVSKWITIATTEMLSVGWLLFFSGLGRSNAPDVVGRERAIDGETEQNKNKERREEETGNKRTKEGGPSETKTRRCSLKPLPPNLNLTGGIITHQGDTVWVKQLGNGGGGDGRLFYAVLILIRSLMRATGF